MYSEAAVPGLRLSFLFFRACFLCLRVVVGVEEPWLLVGGGAGVLL